MEKELVTECNAQVLALNTELVSVRLRREYVEKYRKLGSFTYISEGAKGELIDHIAPLVYMNDPDEYAKRFDNFIYWNDDCMFGSDAVFQICQKTAM